MPRTTLRLAAVLAAAITAPLHAQLQWLRPEGSGALDGRGGSRLAYDSARARTILFGGFTGSAYVNDTWEWDGATWALRTPAVSPPQRTGYAMAYDAARGVTVLFGGASNTGGGTFGDLWEWDGHQWVQRAFSNGPSPRLGAQFAFDAARGRMVLFGGGPGPQLFFPPSPDAHWEWDGQNWSQGPAGPAPRLFAAVVHDPSRARTVVFGGSPQCGPVGFQCPTFGDTWEFDGTSWSLRTTTGPSTRSGAVGEFDLARGRVVLHGGVSQCNPSCSVRHGDTWEWDGLAWTPNTGTPLTEAGAGIAYHAASARTIALAGSQGNETWAYDGLGWSRVATSAGASITALDAMAFDIVQRELLWFGASIQGSQLQPATFAFDGASWRPLGPAISPPARTRHAMAADRQRSRVVLFGGLSTAGAALGDTWEWDGSNWIQRLTTNTPRAQYHHAMAYDTVRGVTVLWPGANGNAEVQEFDGLDWTLRPAPNQPTPRTLAMLAFDEANGRTVLFGGQGNGVLSDTSTWDGSTWTQASPAASPSARHSAGMAFDASRNRIVLFGGTNASGVVVGDTWEWNGATWTQRTAGGSPPPRTGGAMAFDHARNRLVLRSGTAPFGAVFPAHDTWELVTACDRAGPGEVSGGGIPIACSSAPTRGQTFCLDYANTNPGNAGLQFLLLTPGACSTAPLVVPTPPGCAPSFLYGLPTEVHFQVAQQASFCFAVPNQPVFLGAVLCFQGSSLETTGCFRSTDGLTAVVR